jgi:ubiquinone/menaquinone biosynthesis C-methylase UbiE
MEGPDEPRHFAGMAGFYQRYRLDYPERLIARVAGLAGISPGDAVLDLGCGTGMLAIAFAKRGMAVTAMDPEPDMLTAAQAAADAAGATITAIAGGSPELTPQMGPYRLAVMGRSFHWMDRAGTLAMLDNIVTPDGGVVLFHDAHPPVDENRWFKLLCELQSEYGRATAQQGEKRGGHRRYEPYLFASAFTQIDTMSVTIRQPLGIDDIVGRAFSMSISSAGRLGSRKEEFAARLTTALRELSPDGTFTEVAELVAVLARRPYA